MRSTLDILDLCTSRNAAGDPCDRIASAWIIRDGRLVRLCDLHANQLTSQPAPQREAEPQPTH